jgi:hypothetical protein
VYAPPKGSPYADEGLFDNIVAEVGMIQDLGGSILLTDAVRMKLCICKYFLVLAATFNIKPWLMTMLCCIGACHRAAMHSRSGVTNAIMQQLHDHVSIVCVTHLCCALGNLWLQVLTILCALASIMFETTDVYT